VPFSFQNSPGKLTVVVPRHVDFLRLIREVGGATVFFYLLFHRSKPFVEFVSFPMLVTLWASFWSLVSWLKILGGSQYLEFHETQLVVRDQILFVPLRRTFELSEIGEPYWVPEDRDEEKKRTMPPAMHFDYRGDEVVVGEYITESEGLEIVSQVRGLYPELAKRWSLVPYRAIKSSAILTLGLS
jgi:hypothetical protein